MVLVSAFVCAVLAQGMTAATSPPDRLLAVLSDTGRQQDGRPIVARVSEAQHEAVLTSGYSGRVLRLFRMVQRFAHPERAPQPAYLVLSDNQGGFPRAGFVLDGKIEPETTFVDLHRRSDLSGRPGSMDQIFPHELMHIIVAVLAGEAPEGHASQVHAIGVRTDRITAFNEGFAEHAQMMAIDDPGARSETRAIALDVAERDRVYQQFDRYARAVTARWAPAPKARMTFLLWFSRGEQVLRYHAVKDNLFAHEPEVPERLLDSADPYDAYLVENVMPGRPGAPFKPAGRLLATEGVVSALFYRLVNDPAVRNAFRDDAFYAGFGTRRSDVDPLDNAYLKVFSAIHQGHYDAAAVVDSYARLFPAEADVVRRVLRDTLGGQDVPRAPELWLLNEEFTAGTTLFDQYRARPRAQTFDLNAASPAELASVPGLERPLAVAVRQGGPYASVEDLRRVPGMTEGVLNRLREMRRAMEAPPKPGTSEEGSLSIKAIVLPYGWRALEVWLGGAVAAALLYQGRCRRRWWRLALNGLAAMLVGLIAGWTIDSGNGLLALAAPFIVFGVPAGLIALRLSPATAARVALAWLLAAMPGALAVTTMF